MAPDLEKPRDESCLTCCFWRPEKTVGDGYGWGQCRRMPPALPTIRDDKLALVGIWPHTDGRDWCGEWQSRDDQSGGRPPR